MGPPAKGIRWRRRPARAGRAGASESIDAKYMQPQRAQSSGTAVQNAQMDPDGCIRTLPPTLMATAERRFPIRRISAGISPPAGPEAGAPVRCADVPALISGSARAFSNSIGDSSAFFSPADFHGHRPGRAGGEGRSDFSALDNRWPGFRVANESSPRRTPRARPAGTVVKMLVGLTNK